MTIWLVNAVYIVELPSAYLELVTMLFGTTKMVP